MIRRNIIQREPKLENQQQRLPKMKEDKECDKYELPKEIYLILGDGKPMYYFFEVYLLKKLKGSIDETLIGNENNVFPLPVIQIMTNESMTRYRGIPKWNIINEKIIPNLKDFIDEYTNVTDNDFFRRVLNLYKILLSEEENEKDTHNLFTIQPYLRPRLIMQELKYGKADLSFTYIALHRSPESYHTLIRLFKLINKIYNKKSKENEKVNIEIFIFSKESHLNYLILQEVVNVLNNLDNQFNKNDKKYRISGIHYAVLHEEIDELRKIFIQNINLLSKNIDVTSYLNMRVPLYDLISELYASLMRIYTPPDKYRERKEVNGYRLQLCTPDEPYSLLMRILYEIYKMDNRKGENSIPNSFTLYIKPIKIKSNNNVEEYIVEPDIHFLTIHRCPRFRPIHSISEDISPAINKSGHYMVSCKLILKIKKKKQMEPSGSNNNDKEKKFKKLMYYGLYTPRNPHANKAAHNKEQSRESRIYKFHNNCLDRRICPISTFHQNYMEGILRNSPLAKELTSKHFSEDIVKIKKKIVINGGNDDKREVYVEENYKTIAEVVFKLYACLREQPFSFIRLLLSLYPWNLNAIHKMFPNILNDIFAVKNKKEIDKNQKENNDDENKLLEKIRSYYSIIAGISHECLTKSPRINNKEKKHSRGERNFSELYFVKNKLINDIVKRTNIKMDLDLSYPIEKVFFLITDIKKNNEKRQSIIPKILKGYFNIFYENLLFFSGQNMNEQINNDSEQSTKKKIRYNRYMYIKDTDDNKKLRGKYYLVTRRYFSCDEYLCLIAKIKPLFIVNNFYLEQSVKSPEKNVDKKESSDEKYKLITLDELFGGEDLITEKIKEIYEGLTSLSEDSDKRIKLCQLFAPRILIPIIDAEVLDNKRNNLKNKSNKIAGLNLDLERIGLKLGDIKKLNVKITISDLKNCLKKISYIELDLGELCDFIKDFDKEKDENKGKVLHDKIQDLIKKFSGEIPSKDTKHKNKNKINNNNYENNPIPNLYDELFNEETYYGIDLVALLDLVNYHDRKIYDLNHIVDEISYFVRRKGPTKDFYKSYLGLRILLQDISEIKHMHLLRVDRDEENEEELGRPIRDIRILNSYYDLILG